MWGRLGVLKRQIKRRRSHTVCERCGLLYKKSLSTCPNCTGVGDAELAAALAKRKRFREGLGKWMFFGLAAIVLGLIVVNGL